MTRKLLGMEENILFNLEHDGAIGLRHDHLQVLERVRILALHLYPLAFEIIHNRLHRFLKALLFRRKLEVVLSGKAQAEFQNIGAGPMRRAPGGIGEIWSTGFATESLLSLPSRLKVIS